MQLAISVVQEKMTTILLAKGYKHRDIPFIIDIYLGGQLRGHDSHGLASFPGFIAQDYSRCEAPKVVKKTNAFFFMDAKSNTGAVVGRCAADEAIQRAKKEVIGFSMIKNMDNWLRPGAIAQYIANQGLVAIVANSGGNAAIAPPGGYDPVVGTNPIAYGFPVENDVLVVDIATSERAWGQVRLARKHGRPLPANTFYDSLGHITLNPDEARSVTSFGGYKGFSLALLLEVMCGSLVGMDMMLESRVNNATSRKMPERGAFMLVIDPEQTTGLAAFKKMNSTFLERIKATRAINGGSIRIPGEQASALQSAKMASGTIDIPDEVWNAIDALTPVK